MFWTNRTGVSVRKLVNLRLIQLVKLYLPTSKAVRHYPSSVQNRSASDSIFKGRIATDTDGYGHAYGKLPTIFNLFDILRDDVDRRRRTPTDTDVNMENRP